MSKRWLAALMALSLLSGAAHAQDQGPASQEAKPEWLVLHEQAKADYKTTYSTYLRSLTIPGHAPGRVVFKDLVAQERKAERLAAKAAGEGSADHLAVLDSLVVFLGLAEAPGEQVTAARRALTLRLRDAAPNSVEAAQARIGFAGAVGLTPAQNEAMGDTALTEAKAILDALPGPMTDEQADAWGAYTKVARINLGRTPDVLRIEARTFDYWAERKPVTAEVALKTMLASIPLTSDLETQGQLDAVRDLRLRAVNVVAKDPKPTKPLLNLALVEYGKAAMATKYYSPAISAFKWANERLATDTTDFGARQRSEVAGLLSEALAQDAAGRATVRAARAQEAAAEATRTGGIVPTPGLAAIMAQLKSQGVNLERGTK